MKRIITVLLIATLSIPVISQTMNWRNVRSVKNELKSRAKKGQTFYSQFDWYAPRERGDLQSQFSDDMARRPYIYAVDFYYATGTWFTDKYKKQCRDNLVNIVKNAWRDNKAIPSFSWHLENPYVNSECTEYMGCRYRYAPSVWPNYPEEHRFVIREILSGTGEPCGLGGYKRDNNKVSYANPRVWFEAQCKEVADIINQLKDDRGRPIPIIFRIWHECEDTWHWWGTTSCSDDEYKEFFILTEKLILDSAPQARILWGYCTDHHWMDEDNYFRRYPGDKYVDIMGYDDYEICKNVNGESRSLERARVITKIAKDHNKIAAIFETGNKDLNTSEIFFQEIVSEILKDNNTAISIFQMWSSGRYSTNKEKEDRAWMLSQPYIVTQEFQR